MASPPSARWLRVQEIAYAVDLVDRAELRTDQDLLEAQLLYSFDALARLVRRADEIDRRHLCQLSGLGTLGEVDRAIGEDGILAAGFAIDLHAMFKIVPAAEPAGRRPALGFLGGIGDPARAAPSADQDRRPALASRPRRQSAAVHRLTVPRAIHDVEVVFEGAEPVIVIVAEQLEIVARRAAADAEDQAVVRHRLQRLNAMGEFDRIAQRELQYADP